LSLFGHLWFWKDTLCQQILDNKAWFSKLLSKLFDVMKSAFLLLGAQRSGTSVTSHMLSKFDISFGDRRNFLQAEHNPLFFELKWVNQYNDRLIQSLGYKYTDLFLPIEADYDNANIAEIEKELSALIQQEWCDELKIGIKDPRLSLTFPIWQRVLLAQGYTLNIVLVFRHPGNFLHSNQKLFHNWAGWDQERHLHFWLRLNLAAIYFTRALPVFLVNYDGMMEQPIEVAKDLATFFKLDEKQISAAAAVVNPAYHHHKQSSPTDYPVVSHCYRLLCSHDLSKADYLGYRSVALATTAS
jgi:hypothetical protein